ncbi:unnamed protein product [Mycena citricolor]|uniref:Uncharacterized protein n=1 Tax=Mycena citricolor TaxID=2018698 RepID=A0AAD2Q144_9AGAR|nr:unnamed protein product [Mycena citricolor]
MSLLTLFRNLHHLPRRARSPPGPLSALKFFATKMSVPATKQAIAFNQPGDFDVLEVRQLEITLILNP